MSACVAKSTNRLRIHINPKEWVGVDWVGYDLLWEEDACVGYDQALTVGNQVHGGSDSRGMLLSD